MKTLLRSTGFRAMKGRENQLIAHCPSLTMAFRKARWSVADARLHAHGAICNPMADEDGAFSQ